MANPIEDVEGLLSIGILAAIVIGVILLFKKYDFASVLNGLPLFPGQGAAPAPATPPPDATAAANTGPLSDVQSLGSIFSANNPQELWDNFSNWFSSLFHFGDEPAAAPTTPAAQSDGSNGGDYIPPVDQWLNASSYGG